MTECANNKIFNDRVDNYFRYRPGYPKEIIRFLQEEVDLKDDAIIADIGSGTGISSDLFIDNGNTVYGVEPNNNMRRSADKRFEKSELFTSYDGSAECTTLADNSVDLIVAGQAFHWFESFASKKEFLRILRNNGYLVVMFNSRGNDSDFMFDYNKVINKYKRKLEIKTNENTFMEIFNQGFIKSKTFENKINYDLDRLIGDTVSYSYMPNKEDDEYEGLIDELKKLFFKYCEEDGTVEFEYKTSVDLCKL